MTLALAFGRADVDAFLAELDPRQFREWQDFYTLQPWGPERADLRVGLLACALSSLTDRRPDWLPGDFYLSPLDQLTDEERSELGCEDTSVQLAKLHQIGRAWDASH